MIRLITYGDSWTAGHGVETDTKYRGDPCKDNRFVTELRKSNSWPRWLADLYDVPFVNISVCGNNHVKMANDIEDTAQYLEKDDLVIVMLSYLYRLPPKQFYSKKYFEPILKMQDVLQSSNTKNYYFVNSFYPTFVDFPDKIKEFDTSKFLNIDSTVGQYLSKYEKQNNVSIWEYGNRSLEDDPDFEWGGWHPNLLGYKVIAEYIYKLIKGKNNECRH